MVLKRFLFLLVAVCLATSVQAQEARVVIPDAPSGAYVSGCYRADRQLYGPYRLIFCIDRDRRGTYSVESSGLRCDGRLNWRMRDDTLSINLRRQSCNRARAWAAAEISCRPRGLLSVILDELIRDLTREGRAANSRVVVPDRPTVGRLNCTYFPTVEGTRQRQFFANRSVIEPR